MSPLLAQVLSDFQTTQFQENKTKPAVRNLNLDLRQSTPMLSVPDNKHGSGAGYGVTGDAYPNNVSVNDVPTTAGATDPAMAAAAAAAGSEEETSLTLSQSEASPPRPFRPAMGARRRTASRTSSGERLKIGVTKTIETKRAASKTPSRPPSPGIASRMGKWASARAPSPGIQRMDVGEHQVITAEASDAETRLAALEQQRAVDHAYLEQVAAAIHILDKALTEERDKRLNLEAETVKTAFEQRRDLAGRDERILGEIPTRMAKFFEESMGPKLEQRFGAAQGILDAVKVDIQRLSVHEVRVEKYLEGLVADRPREGQAIQQLVDTEVGQVRNLIKQFEASGHVPKIGVSSVPFTSEMFIAIRDIEAKVATVDQVVQNYNGMADKVNVAFTSATEHAVKLANAEMRITAAEAQIAAHDAGYYAQGEQMAPTICMPPAAHPAPRAAHSLNLAAAFQAGTAAAPDQCTDSCCAAAVPGGQGLSTAAPPGIAQGRMPGSSGDGNPMGAMLARVTLGNGVCHCAHVELLIAQVAALERRPAAAPQDPMVRHDPWGGFGHGRAGGDGGPAHGAPAAGAQRAPKSLPLDLKGPLGSIGYKDRSIFDQKLSLQEEFRFNGTKGGLTWKGKTERYFISCAQVLKDLLAWAEECDLDTISVDKLKQAIGNKLTEEQVLNVNAAIWGFLSGAVSGTAETIFKRSETLNGIDAWRRLAHYVEHGKEVRLETLRREVKMLHTRPIPGLDKVEEGIAEWENVMNEYALAGGTSFSDAERKADLLAVLPAELRELMLWNSTKAEIPYDAFRDHVINQSSKILMNRKKLPVHSVDVDGDFDIEDDGSIDFQNMDFSNINSIEDMLAAIERLQKKNGGRFQRRDGGRERERREGGGGGGRERERDPSRPRRCPNCGDSHSGRCTKPQVALNDRKCFGCGKPGHISARCPNKDKKNAQVNNLNLGEVAAVDRGDGKLRGFFMVDEEGFQKVGKDGKVGRPMPAARQLGNFISANTFAVLPQDVQRRRTQDATPRNGRCATTPSAEGGCRPKSGKSKLTSSTTPITESGARSCVPTDEAVKPKPRGRPCQQVRRALREAQQIIDDKNVAQIEDPEINEVINVVYEEEELIGMAAERVIVRPAMDSGSVANVIHPKELPRDAEPMPNTAGKDFVGANNSKIERYGKCRTKLESKHGAVGCDWELADVSRPLHSVSTVTGPKEGPGKQDVLFNNRLCVVVPPGVVDKILETIKPVMQYDREGNLYVGEMEMSTFGRQGAVA